MATLGTQMETLLASWDDATAPIDSRVREDPLLFASVSEILAKHPKKPACNVQCRPWEHEDFLARVSSFSIASWFAKPDVISAFECARHGWMNSAPDQLHCNCCKQFLCFKINDKLSTAGALKVAHIFAEQLITGHTELCPWRGNPSPEAFTTLPIASKRQVYETFMVRLEELVTQMHKKDERMKSIKVMDAVAAKILKEADDSEDAADFQNTTTFASKLLAKSPLLRDASVSSEVLVNAAFLVVCGWQFDDKDEEMLWCGSCNRRWQAIPTKKNDGEESEPPAKRMKTDAVQSVDLLSQHRHFCPWVAERKSTGVDDYGEMDPKLWEFIKLPGWKQYAQALCFLGNLEDRAIVAVASSDLNATKVCDPVEALESIRAVLGL
ncbi:Rsm1-like [Phytophthora infestans]|uniref:Rsm1-like n=1 Tax=Phytophthora infestans TaxID=4787 RepID=A0A8S9TZX1_PHYIN|nr:Rsm1-like [Phytophthora infestans]